MSHHCQQTALGLLRRYHEIIALLVAYLSYDHRTGTRASSRRTLPLRAGSHRHQERRIACPSSRLASYLGRLQSLESPPPVDDEAGRGHGSQRDLPWPELCFDSWRPNGLTIIQTRRHVRRLVSLEDGASRTSWHLTQSISSPNRGIGSAPRASHNCELGNQLLAEHGARRTQVKLANMVNGESRLGNDGGITVEPVWLDRRWILLVGLPFVSSITKVVYPLDRGSAMLR